MAVSWFLDYARLPSQHTYTNTHTYAFPYLMKSKCLLKHGICKGSNVDDETTKISVSVEWPWSMERPTFSASKMKTWTLCAWNISFLCWNGADGEESQLRTSLISYTSIFNFSMVLWLNIGPYRYHMTPNLNQLKGCMIGFCSLLDYIFTSCTFARMEKVHLKDVKKCGNV